MSSLNKAQLIGNLTREPELKTTSSGTNVATIGIATNRAWTDSSGTKKDQAEFHNIVVWGKLADICCKYLKKGSKVYFSGRLQTRSWEDDSGSKHYRTEIVADEMIMLDSKGGSNDSVGSSDPEMSVDDLPF